MFEENMYIQAAMELHFLLVPWNTKKKNLIKEIFYIHSWITIYDRKGCFIIMSDLRLTIEDMIACISFVDVIHVASFELVERIEHKHTYTKNEKKKYAQFYFLPTVLRFFPFRFFSWRNHSNLYRIRINIDLKKF